jgi:hypothetical protein
LGQLGLQHLEYLEHQQVQLNLLRLLLRSFHWSLANPEFLEHQLHLLDLSILLAQLPLRLLLDQATLEFLEHQ